MARKKQESHDAFEELESLGERLLQWTTANAVLVGGVAAAVLLVAAGVGGYRAWNAARADAASTALAELRSELLVAMGGEPGDAEIPEPANPETAQRVRTEFAERYLEMAREHAGTTGGALALIQAGQLQLDLGQPEQALETWQSGLEGVPGGSPVRAVLQSRIARLYEQEGRFDEAARRHEAAAAIDAYPLRYVALGDAARCWIAAGEPETALALYGRIKSESPEARLPADVQTRLDELAARP